ncbi:Myb-binding protein 1A [Saguinus oedipus]|uniref:Myb-binding protein 1A n=1 Tax=Saguinus oedipus TaxID=9490 RepID=A0ABQ9TBU0_SAGOE|nr:Myb-binding protein 1A [Saguinus oedipus]
MALDQNLTSIFAEQKLWIQARQDEKSKPQKEKLSQLQVLDLVEVLVTKQPENVLVLELLEPLLGIIQCSLRSSSSKQEQDLLHKTACIFMWAWEQGGWVWLAVPSPQPPGRTPGLLFVQEREPSFQPGP